MRSSCGTMQPGLICSCPPSCYFCHSFVCKFNSRKSKMSTKGEVWTDEETLSLINAWGDSKILAMMQGTNRNSKIYSEISEAMMKDGHNREWKQCRTKAKHLKNQYKKYKDSLKKSGNVRGKEPKFFKELDRILGDTPEAEGLEHGIDSSCREDVADDDSEDDVLQKYGEGETYEMNCPKCNHLVEMMTPGAYFGRSGKVERIYSEVDPFECPNCFFKEDPTPEKVNDPKDKNESVQAQETKRKIAEEKKEKNDGKKRKTKKSSFDGVMKDFIDYQQKSDDNFLKNMADQQAAERELREKECKAFTGAIGMLASAIAGQSNPSNSSQHVGNQQYNVQADYYDIEQQGNRSFFNL